MLCHFHRGSNKLSRGNRWMSCDFTSFSTVFQSYRDNGWVIMKGYVQWNSVYDEKDHLKLGSNPAPLPGLLKINSFL